MDGTKKRSWQRSDDDALDAILWLRQLWEARHVGYAWALDKWGEGPSRVSLLDLGLNPRIVTVRLMGICPSDDRFFVEWSGRPVDEVPMRARCGCGRWCAAYLLGDGTLAA